MRLLAWNGEPLSAHVFLRISKTDEVRSKQWYSQQVSLFSIYFLWILTLTPKSFLSPPPLGIPLSFPSSTTSSFPSDARSSTSHTQVRPPQPTVKGTGEDEPILLPLNNERLDARRAEMQTCVRRALQLYEKVLCAHMHHAMCVYACCVKICLSSVPMFV